MEIGPAAAANVNQGAGNNSAESGVRALTRATEEALQAKRAERAEKAEQIEKAEMEKAAANENVRAEIAQETGKGQNVDVKA